MWNTTVKLVDFISDLLLHNEAKVKHLEASLNPEIQYPDTKRLRSGEFKFSELTRDSDYQGWELLRVVDYWLNNVGLIHTTQVMFNEGGIQFNVFDGSVIVVTGFLSADPGTPTVEFLSLADADWQTLLLKLVDYLEVAEYGIEWDKVNHGTASKPEMVTWMEFQEMLLHE